MNNFEQEIKEFNELLENLDFNDFELVDQLKCALAFEELVRIVKPILIKYAAKDQKITNFLFKM